MIHSDASLCKTLRTTCTTFYLLNHPVFRSSSSHVLYFICFQFFLPSCLVFSLLPSFPLLYFSIMSCYSHLSSLFLPSFLVLFFSVFIFIYLVSYFILPSRRFILKTTRVHPPYFCYPLSPPSPSRKTEGGEGGKVGREISSPPPIYSCIIKGGKGRRLGEEWVEKISSPPSH